MNAVELELANGAVNVDAKLIAEELGLEPAQVLDSMRNGQLTAVCEQGIAEDAGRFRLTFYHEGRRFRLLIDQESRVLERSTVKVRRHTPLLARTLARSSWSSDSE